MKITPGIIKLPKGGSWRLSRRAPNSVISLRTTKPRPPRAPVHPCSPTQDKSDQPAYQGQLRGLARDWKSGTGHSDQPFPIHTVAIDKTGWRDFAFAHPFATNTFPVRSGTIPPPWEYRRRTGYQLFQAWNQAALSAQFYRLQYTHNWNPKYPFTLVPNPPASYAPRFVTDIRIDLHNFPPFIGMFVDGQPNTDHFYIVLSASKPARSQPGKGPHALEYLGGEEWFPDPLDPVATGDLGRWQGRWGCYGPGYVDFGVYLVDFDTNTPGPVFRKTFHLSF